MALTETRMYWAAKSNEW